MVNGDHKSHTAAGEMLVKRYIEAMQSGDAATVRTLSWPDARLEYPDGIQFDSPEALFEWAHGRHRWVRHDIEHCDSVRLGDDHLIVYLAGTLAGAWGDSTPFGGIRFIYRFRVKGGRVAETRLWSDVAEVLRRSRG